MQQLLPIECALHIHEMRDLLLTSVPGFQKTLSHAIHKHTYTEHLKNAQSDRQRAITRSSRGPGAAGALAAIPATHKLTLTNTQMQIFMHRRLCLPLSSCVAGNGTCVCGQHIDPFGDHLLSCKYGNERFVRHNALVYTAGTILQQVGLRPTIEKRLTQLGIVENKPGQRMDVTYLDKNTSVTCIDMSVTHSAANTYVHAAAYSDGHAITLAEGKKNAKYRQKVQAAGCRFIPIIVETEGRWGEVTARWLRDLAKPIADAAENNSTFVRNKLVDRAWKVLGCVLQKYNANLILSRTVAANHYTPYNTYTNPHMGLPGGAGLQELFVPEWV